jgi:beta-lactamase regulating signal transducer with metallopeptidase domain
MKKSHLLCVVCAGAIAFVSASTNAAEGVVHNAGKYDSHDTSIQSMATEANQAKRNLNEPLASNILAIILISFGLIGFVLLHKVYSLRKVRVEKKVNQHSTN